MNSHFHGEKLGRKLFGQPGRATIGPIPAPNTRAVTNSCRSLEPGAICERWIAEARGHDRDPDYRHRLNVKRIIGELKNLR